MRSEQFMRDYDLFPTLEAAAGLRIHAPAESENLWPVMMGARRVHREPFFFALDFYRDLETRGHLQRAVIHRGWKLVTMDFLESSGDVSREFFLFDLEADPRESTNLAAERPRLVARLDRRITRWERLHPEDGARLPGYVEATYEPPRAHGPRGRGRPGMRSEVESWLGPHRPGWLGTLQLRAEPARRAPMSNEEKLRSPLDTPYNATTTKNL